MKGIKDTKTVQNKMGERLREARGKMKRPALIQLLKECPKAPVESKAEMNTERLKQWEYGNNPISHEWIPAICDVLDCDVGYLFGEYEERHRISADISAETGLTESAIQKLRSIKSCNPEYPPTISILIEDYNFEYLLCLLNGRFLYSAPAYNVKPVVEMENGVAHLKNAREFHKSLNEGEVKIQLDNLALIAKKKNLLDSMISTTLIDMMRDMAAAFQEKMEGDRING